MTNDQNFNHYQGASVPPPPSPSPHHPIPEEPKKRGVLRRALPYVAVGVLGLMIGGVAGGASDTDSMSDNETAQELDSAPEVETVTVSEVPGECLTALGDADIAIELYSEGFTLAADALGAYEVGDYASMDQKTQEINDLHGELTTTLTSYYLNSDECRGQ